MMHLARVCGFCSCSLLADRWVVVMGFVTAVVVVAVAAVVGSG